MGPAGRTSLSLKRRQSISPILREEPADYNTFNLQHDQLTLLDASPPSSGVKKSAKSPHDSLTGSAVNELLNGSATAAGTVIIDTPSGQIRKDIIIFNKPIGGGWFCVFFLKL